MYYVITFEATNDWEKEIIITRSKAKAGIYIVESHWERSISIDEYDTKEELEKDHPNWPLDDWIQIN